MEIQIEDWCRSDEGARPKGQIGSSKTTKAVNSKWRKYNPGEFFMIIILLNFCFQKTALIKPSANNSQVLVWRPKNGKEKIVVSAKENYNKDEKISFFNGASVMDRKRHIIRFISDEARFFLFFWNNFVFRKRIKLVKKQKADEKKTATCIASLFKKLPFLWEFKLKVAFNTPFYLFIIFCVTIFILNKK